MKKSRKQIGKTFKTLTIKEYKGSNENHVSLWMCVCSSCGVSGVYDFSTLKRHKVFTACITCKEKQKGFCAKGHDISLWGRTPGGGTCRACLRERNIFREYGITMDEYKALWEFQGGRCAICGRDISILAPGMPGWHVGTRTEVDHKHGTNLPKKQTVRGLLCGGRWAGCNRKLGRLDNITWLQNALNYITNPPAKQLFEKVSNEKILTVTTNTSSSIVTSSSEESKST